MKPMPDPGPTRTDACTLVFDIGKTHYKVTLLGPAGEKLFSRRAPNRPVDRAPYRHFDVDGIWRWLLEQLSTLSCDHAITAISIATHGAAAALVDLETGELVLPVMDYEQDDFAIPRAEYDALVPPFAETFSPPLPAGLNLGRQLHAQWAMLDETARARVTVLPFPNYWALRLSGRACWEVSSLGCHTDLWNPVEGRFSALVERLGIADSFPERIAATDPLGTVCPGIAAATGLPASCKVWPGMHDSNAGYVPYLAIPKEQRPSVLSTGTWSILLACNTSFARLDPALDLLANTDILGNPLATARFMGGREFEAICEMTNCDIATHCDAAQVVQTIAEGSFALPSFAHGSGPMGIREGRLVGPATHGKALAALYCALMLDHMLDLLAVTGPVAIEGSFASNPVLCGILATLRPAQAVLTAQSDGGVIDGCWRVTCGGGLGAVPTLAPVGPLNLPGLADYRAAWHARIAAL